MVKPCQNNLKRKCTHWERGERELQKGRQYSLTFAWATIVMVTTQEMTTSETIFVWVRMLLFVTLSCRYLKISKLKHPWFHEFEKKKLEKEKEKHRPFSLFHNPQWIIKIINKNWMHPQEIIVMRNFNKLVYVRFWSWWKCVFALFDETWRTLNPLTH